MAMEHPGQVEDITHEWLAHSLEGCGFLGDEKIISFANEPFDPGAGQLSAITRVRLDYDRPSDLPRSLVLKFHAPTDAAHQVSMRFRAYEREHRFFADVASSAPVPAPICHASFVDEGRERYILVLEDLAEKQFVDQLDGASYDQATRIVKALAKLHASTWGPDKLAKLDWLPFINGDVNASMQSDIERNWPAYLAKYGPILPDGAEQIGLTLAKRTNDLLNGQADLAKALGNMCVCHGDSRLDNLALGSGDEVYLFDWQLTFKNLGPVDVSYFLGGSVPTELRREKERELVEVYYDELCRGGVDDLSIETCWDIYRLGHLYFLSYMVIGGTETDVSNERSFKIFQTASERQFTSALDHDSLGLLDSMHSIGR